MLSVGYIGIIVVAEAFPIHLYYVTKSLPLDYFLALFAFTWCVIILLTILAAVVPMRLAI